MAEKNIWNSIKTEPVKQSTKDKFWAHRSYLSVGNLVDKSFNGLFFLSLKGKQLELISVLLMLNPPICLLHQLINNIRIGGDADCFDHSVSFPLINNLYAHRPAFIFLLPHKHNSILHNGTPNIQILRDQIMQF
jgi:hypothetical protein